MSLQEYRDYVSYRAERKARANDDTERKVRLRVARETVRLRLVPYRQGIQRAKSEVRAELIRNLLSLPAPLRIEHLAWDDQHPLSFFPIELAVCEDAIWDNIDEETRVRLCARASTIPRGPWRKWLKELKRKSAHR